MLLSTARRPRGPSPGAPLPYPLRTRLDSPANASRTTPLAEARYIGAVLHAFAASSDTHSTASLRAGSIDEPASFWLVQYSVGDGGSQDIVDLLIEIMPGDAASKSTAIPLMTCAATTRSTRHTRRPRRHRGLAPRRLTRRGSRLAALRFALRPVHLDIGQLPIPPGLINAEWSSSGGSAGCTATTALLRASENHERERLRRAYVDFLKNDGWTVTDTHDNILAEPQVDLAKPEEGLAIHVYGGEPYESYTEGTVFGKNNGRTPSPRHRITLALRGVGPVPARAHDRRQPPRPAPAPRRPRPPPKASPTA